MMTSKVPAQILKQMQCGLRFGMALMTTLLLVACTDQSITSTEKEDVASQTSGDSTQPSADTVKQVDGTTDYSRVLQAKEDIEPNTVLPTSTGVVSPQGDRIVQVENFSVPERSVVAIEDSTGNQLTKQELPYLVGPVKFSPDGQQIIASGTDSVTRIWDTQLNQIASFDQHQEIVQHLQVSPDGNYFLTTEYPYEVPVGQYPNTTVRVFDREATELGSFETELNIEDSHQAVQLSPNSQQLLMVMDGVVQLTDFKGVPQQTFSQTLNLVPQKFTLAQFSPDGRFVLAASQEAMQMWDVQGNLKAEFQHWTLTSDEKIESLQLSNDGQFVATGSSKGLLRFWDAQSNQVVTVQAHPGEIHAIAISPDGTQIATLGEKDADASGNSDIRLWNLQGELIGAFEENLADQNLESFAVQFAPDATQLIATEMGQGVTTIQWKL